MKKEFNIIISGVGGQGLITLLSVIDEAAFIEGNEVRSSELHGLSQREGSVEAYIRFGKDIHSPIVDNGKADLIISLELIEGLRTASKAGEQTKVLINRHLMPFNGSPKEENVLKELSSFKNLHLIPASDICKDKLQNEVVSTIYLLGYAVSKKLIPLKEKSVLVALDKIIPEKYLELNKKAFHLDD